jgi:hypothetical protein
VRVFAKATSAGSTEAGGIARGLFRRALVTRGSSRDFDGSGAPAIRRIRAFAAPLAVAAVLVGLTAGSAQAATPVDAFGYKVDFGGGGFFFTPGTTALAVQQGSGNIFFGDQGSGSVYIDSPDSDAGGVALTSFSPFGLAGLGPQNIAVDSSDGTVYVADTFYGNGVAKLDSDGAPTPTYSLNGAFDAGGASIGSVSGLAVDSATHNLIVADHGSNVVRRLSSSGALLGTYDGTGGGGEAFSNVGGIAVSVSGKIYVVDGTKVRRLNADGTADGALPLAPGGTPGSIAVNPSDGRVVVSVTRGTATNFDGFSAAGVRIFSSQLPVSGTPVGLGWDSGTGRVYYETSDAAVHTFEPVTGPGLDAPVASDLDQDGAHVSANVATGGEDTTARLEYCRADRPCFDFPVSDPNDPNNPWVRGPDHANLNGGGDPAAQDLVEDDLPLTPNRTWRVRVYAANSRTDNTETTTVDAPLLAPGVQTGNAGSIKQDSAELAGVVSTFGDPTTYHFEYGTDVTYGSEAPASGDAPAGNNFAPRSVTQAISNLQPETTYHYRLVATNSLGTSEGSDRTFTTDAAGGSTPQRAYEQVTPIDKNGAFPTAITNHQTADDGNATAIATTAGSSSDAETADIFSNYLARRTEDGWENWKPIDPPRNVMPEAGIVAGLTAAMSPDFNHALVVSNRVLTPGGIEYGTNFYLRDMRISGPSAYTLLGAAPVPGFGLVAGIGAIVRIYWGGAPDFSWIYFESQVPLLPGVTAPQVYRWSAADGLQLASALPDGTASPFGDYWMGFYSNGTRKVSDDGNVIYFADGNGGQTGTGIYRRELGESSKPISVSEIPLDPDTSPHPGRLDGISASGRYAYFETTAALTTDAPNDPINGNSPMLYRYDADAPAGSRLEYIAVGSPFEYGTQVDDSGDTIYFVGGDGNYVWRRGTLRPLPNSSFAGSNVVTISPDGQYAVFGDNAGDGLDPHVLLFDADTGEEQCVSCAFDGSPSAGAIYGNGARSLGNRQTNAVTDDGEVFFDTPARLTSDDHNGTVDVYSYKDGKQTLISPGDQQYDARFMDASVDGSNVFFTTDQGLVSQDVDGETDVYDARIGGGFASQNQPPPVSCQDDGCQDPPSSAPGAPGVGSSTFNGPGNQGKDLGGAGSKAKPKCKKGKKDKKGKKKGCRKSTKRGARTAGMVRRAGK